MTIPRTRARLTDITVRTGSQAAFSSARARGSTATMAAPVFTTVANFMAGLSEGAILTTAAVGLKDAARAVSSTAEISAAGIFMATASAVANFMAKTFAGVNLAAAENFMAGAFTAGNLTVVVAPTVAAAPMAGDAGKIGSLAGPHSGAWRIDRRPHPR